MGSINEVGLTIDVNKTNIAGGFISRGIINGPPNPGLRSLPTKSKFLAVSQSEDYGYKALDWWPEPEEQKAGG